MKNSGLLENLQTSSRLPILSQWNLKRFPKYDRIFVHQAPRNAHRLMLTCRSKIFIVNLIETVITETGETALYHMKIVALESGNGVDGVEAANNHRLWLALWERSWWNGSGIPRCAPTGSSVRWRKQIFSKVCLERGSSCGVRRIDGLVSWCSRLFYVDYPMR